MIDWIQNNWYEFGNLAVQFAMLVVVVSYGRKALRILALPLTTSRAASQAQVELIEDLQKLTQTRGLRPQAEPAVLARTERTSPWRALVVWLQTPMGNRPGPAWRRVSRPVPAQPEAVASYGGVGRMLSMPEAPVGSYEEPAVPARRESISPMRALIVWLRAPMGNRPGPAWRRVSRQVS
jgi:hypothetical protein